MMLHSHHNCVCEDEKCYCQLKIPVINHVKEYLLAAFGFINFDLQLFSLTNFLNLYPRLLLVCHKHTSKLLFFFDFIEVIYDNSNKQIDYELTANDHECANVYDGPYSGIFFWLHFNAHAINTVPHDISPSLCCHHLEQSKESYQDIVKVSINIVPFATRI
jgi:hypothetical protein